MKEKTNRNQTFQYLMVFAIISVIMGHVDLDTFPLLNSWFTPYSYHMAMFLFISGYFYKEENRKDTKALLSFIGKKCKNLLIPLYLWNLFYGLVTYVISFQGFALGQMPNIKNILFGPIYDGQHFGLNMPSWFVFPLFLVQVLFAVAGYVIYREKSAGKVAEVVTTLVLFVISAISVYLVIRGNVSPVYLVYLRVSFFAFFYQIGRMYRKYLEEWDTLGHLAYFSICFAIQFLILFLAKGRLDYVIAGGSQFENGPVLPFITALTGIAFYLRLAKICAKGIGESRAVNTICSYAFSIMMHQFVGFYVVKIAIGICQRLFGIFGDFSMDVIKINIWYYYFPRNVASFGVFYIVGGIVVPILIGMVTKKAYAKIWKEHR